MNLDISVLDYAAHRIADVSLDSERVEAAARLTEIINIDCVTGLDAVHAGRPQKVTCVPT